MLAYVRILLVDDSAAMRAAIRGLLRSEPGFDVVGEASDGASAVRLAAELAPDLILMDVQMPGEFDGIEATRRIVAANALATHAPPTVIALSGSGEHARAMADAGAVAFVPKEKAHELLDVIRASREGSRRMRTA